MTQRKWLFYCGSQYIDWNDKWCCSCKNYVPDSVDGEGCPIEESMSIGAVIGDSEPVPDGLVEREGNYYDCYICTKYEREAQV